MDYIKLSEAIDLVLEIPVSSSSDTVTYEIFSSAGSVLASGSMTFVRDEVWKVSYTPAATGVITLKGYDATIDSKRSRDFRVVGAVISPDGITTADLTSLAHVREYLKKETADTTDDAFIQDVIGRVSAAIEKRTGRTFISTAHTEYRRGDGSDRMLMRQFPIISVTSIHVDEDRAWGADAAIDADVINIADEVPGEIILNGDIFDRSFIENVRVIYVAGYTTIPYDLESSCVKLCAIEYIESRRMHTRIEGERDLQEEKDKLWKFIVNNYKAVSA